MHGFFSTGLTQGSSRLVGKLGSRLGRILAAAALGGAVSEVTGGKFANGAVTGAFSHAFNDLVHDTNDLSINDEERKFASEGDRESFWESRLERGDPPASTALKIFWNQGSGVFADALAMGAGLT